MELNYTWKIVLGLVGVGVIWLIYYFASHEKSKPEVEDTDTTEAEEPTEPESIPSEQPENE